VRPRLDPATISPEQLLYQGDDVRVGTFCCPVAHPEFRTAGQIEGYTVVFPRSAVWIVPEGRRPFVADSRVIVLYNKGQPYTRRALAADGDRVDWFSVGPTLAAAIAHGIDPDCDPTRPFRATFVASSATLYYRQRRFLTRVRDWHWDPFLIEQEVVGLVGAAMEAGCLCTPNDQRLTHRASRDAIESARAELARDPTRAITVRELARRVSLSPFHLCRLFRRQTGTTMHHYLMELRLRLALERLEDRGVDLSRVAHDTGFSSHSHFSATFRRGLGLSPSRAREELASSGDAMRNRLTASSAA
jgi:AraC family transcriptional regulator